jgi:uncharacterized membrane protein (DUF485 family)
MEPRRLKNVAASRSQRIGMRLFFLYVLLYAGFIGLVLFGPAWLSWRPLGGVNLAIAYGMGLIAAAFLLALLYMVACRDTGGSPDGGES